MSQWLLQRCGLVEAAGLPAWLVQYRQPVPIWLHVEDSWPRFLRVGLEQAFLHPPLVYIFWIHSSSLRQFLDFSWKCAHPQPSHLSYSHSFPLGANLDSHILYLQSYVKLGSIEHSYNPGNQRLRQEDCEFKTALGNKWWDSCQSVK